MSLLHCYLRRDDLYGRHEAVSDDGDSHEHVHERHEVDHRSGDLVAEAGLVRLPDGQQDAGFAHRHLITLIFGGRPRKVSVGQGCREGGRECGGKDRLWNGVSAVVAELGLRLAGRQWDQYKEEEEEGGCRRSKGRHVGVQFPRAAWREGGVEDDGSTMTLGRAENGATGSPADRCKIKNV